MANPQHIEWLLEGVESWNARREREDFTPDFEGADLRAAFAKAGKLSGHGRIPLKGANLRRADLRGADLRVADLGRAHLQGANLGRADLRGANLEYAELGRRSFVAGVAIPANFAGADVRTFVYTAASTDDSSGAVYSYLRHTFGFTKEQISQMNGDSGTVLPDGLKRPAHWPEFDLEAVSPSDEPMEHDNRPDPAPFVFVIVPENEGTRVAQIADVLKSEDVAVWKDRSIAIRNRTSEGIPQFAAADCVLAMWTEASTSSNSIREAAFRAQRADKLIEVRLDNVPLPKGFGYTRYFDLANWDGSTDYPAIQNLIKAIRQSMERPSELDVPGESSPPPDTPTPRTPDNHALSPVHASRALVPAVKARSVAEIRAALTASYPDASALASYLADQVQREIATHKLLPIPNEDDALNAHNAKANFLNEALVVVLALHEALPVEHQAEVTEAEAKTVRDRLVELAKVVQNGINYLDSHPGSYGNLWKIGLIGALANLFTVMSIPIAVGAPIAAGVVGISTFRLIVQRGKDET